MTASTHPPHPPLDIRWHHPTSMMMVICPILTLPSRPSRLQTYSKLRSSMTDERWLGGIKYTQRWHKISDDKMRILVLVLCQVKSWTTGIQNVESYYNVSSPLRKYAQFERASRSYGRKQVALLDARKGARRQLAAIVAASSFLPVTACSRAVKNSIERLAVRWW